MNFGTKEIILILAFLSILVVPVVLVIIFFVVRKNRSAVENLKACPFCAEMIKAQAKVCRFCGRDVAV